MGIRERRERERELRKAQIRKAGTKVFLKKGLESCTIQDIARLAELGRATVYYYYPSKKIILKDILIKGINDLFEDLSAHLRKAKNEIDLVERMVHFYIDFFKKETLYLQIYYLALASARPAWVKDVLKDLWRVYENWLEKIEEIVTLHTNKRTSNKIIHVVPPFTFGLGLYFLYSRNTDNLYTAAHEFFKMYKKGIPKTK